MGRQSNTSDRPAHWLWVTRPQYYLDEDGNDSPDLLPGVFNEKIRWSCHEDTKKGDLILLYRSVYMKDIGYLIRAKSDAEYRRSVNLGDGYWCHFQSLHKFANPVTIQDLRNDSVMRVWKPLRICFQRRVFPIEPVHWQRLNELIREKNPDYPGLPDL